MSYRAGDMTFLRQAFVSHPDQAIVWHVGADKPGQFNFSVRSGQPSSGAADKRDANNAGQNNLSWH